MPVRDDINAEKKKFKYMSFKEKVQYIWDYYKVPILVFLVVAIAVFVLIRDFINNNRETYLYACMLNTNYAYSGDTALRDQYIDYAKVDTEAMQLIIDTGMSINPESIDQVGLAYQQKLMALFSAGDLDVMIASEPVTEQFAINEAFLNPEEVLPEDLKTELEQMGFTYYQVKLEDGTTVPAGIYLEGCKRFEEDGDFGTYSKGFGPIFTIAHNTQHFDHAVEYLRFLIAENNR